MNHFSHLKVLALALCLCLSLGLVACTPGGTDKPAPSENQKTPQEAVTPPASPVELTAEGELRSVNIEAMTFVVRDATGLDRTFAFTPSTRIIGAPSLQGLAGKQGSRARVSYTAQGDTNSATSVEIAEATPAPGAQKDTSPGGQKQTPPPAPGGTKK